MARQRFPSPRPCRPLLAGVLVLCALLAGGCSLLRRGDALSTEPTVAARQIVDAMGGQRALDQLRYLRFDFVVMQNGQEQLRRAHTWDRQKGRYRLETRQGSLPIVTLMNVGTRQGIVVVNGQPAPPAQQKDLLDQAYASFINDTYWLMAATKLRDPGAQLEFVGPQSVEGRELPTYQLRFNEGIGLTPLDRYWFHIDPQTHRPAAWSFVLKGTDAPPTTFLWSQWQPVGQFVLPARFDAVGGGQQILFDKLYSPGAIEDRVFALP